ncbi:MAG: hypothetical protein UW37_C0021G0005 [Candidatus Gottesmanbacteria bacterium GW2011_GWA2_44_17]|uniref:Prepilin-type N-terminal cleavage/methylation domain-containing protein n=3 Tax=Candidatus Gottesmaniibacteriota TaxID=1752720 RepID=A0A0G1IM89_9BACT|nr:MAG: hypothetical protein UV63_C0034G0007 [Microgenomates group bacterium GW2011_GWC1_43_11]KKT38013.1 MAG: hypothetical protein UW22_C0015G0023 [Candidatus Gottesmanbacteria bacterium GW2011_GWB1_44_11c]KKT46580.1 MAG: hypothetical protein UW37_C0021G0005 [Candidatus Gottesmanbacteria bacterium GW2011_GWA2_44_17]KKT60240.1 MAG: hypothetical protein UW52_C0028G0005 [Candidatus Gottesmanbacteria bacterium GW2011_GWA1_44_24b]HCM82688.1 hypothetical protein [Patescibacteria group bacterium]
MKQCHKKRFSFGFTLLELLVTAVIMMFLSIIITQVFFSTMRTNSKTETVRSVKENGDRAIEILTRLVQRASLIQLPVSCPEYTAPVGDTLDEVRLTNADETQTILQCIDVDGAARIASVSATQTIYLTDSSVSLVDPVALTNTCTNHALAFTCAAVAGVPSYITVSFTLRQKDSSESVEGKASDTFQTTVTLRNK